MTDIFDREPPHKDLIEQVVLGGMMTDRAALDEATRLLDEQDFYQPRHQVIFDAIVRESQTAGEVTPVVVAEALKRDGQLENIGGVEYLTQLTVNAPSRSNIEYYANLLLDSAMQRRVIQAGMRITQLGHAEDASIDDILALALDEAFRLGDSDREKRDYRIAYDVAAEMLTHIDDVQNGLIEQGVPTGFRDIDEVTHGLQPGQMIVVAGRPAMGKSTLGMDFARHAAMHENMPTIIFSLEMSGPELMQRLFSAETDIPLAAFRGADGLNPKQWDEANHLWETLKSKPLYVDDSPNMTMNDIRAKCRRLQKSAGLKLVVIDYLQLMTVSGRSMENRQQEVSTLSRSIKMLAKELAVPVVVLAQLNRNVEQRSDKVPMLSDLRESGSIEQDADVVMLVHRPEMYAKEERPGEADVILAKHRNGPTDTFHLAFLGTHSRFCDMVATPGA